MTERDERSRTRTAGQTAGAAGAGAGAAAAATAAVACCVPVVSPLLVAALGASGAAWITGLKPWAPYLLGVALFLLLFSFWRLRRSPSCRTAGEESSRTWVRWLERATPLLLAISTIVWLGSFVGYLILR